MRILVFGQTGQVAHELQRQAKVTALSRAQADLSVPGVCAEAIAQFDGELVINAAAYTAVDRAESDEALAQRINGDAPGEMARACADLGIPFLHVSTDYVFDGSGKRARAESGKVNPINVYGRTKLAGEKAVRKAGGKTAVLRTSWVFSSHGANFVKTMLRLAETRSALTVVDDQIGGPTPAADIASALLSMGRAMAGGHPGGLYHYSGAPAASWADFAREIFAQSGQDVAVTGIPSSDYPTPAARPLNSRLDCRKLTEDFGIAPPDWRAGLTRVLDELGVMA
ncbi:dTDP-4-dehydrorhamnose reductase [Pseudooceanicola spongiae]|uniref:dTDP-4-dehydrorhamnose reductase n=1 Tax=Pseudooceanicola spongiae TaxID=2613965 RepID=A0A7L9WMU4_9RHOB|nr:dTDP-4-dehydrorhamnose reductase [Pseudooceanicola spongiae]QOL81549.1 dTDP-4-dehydrorhamnose reductase [Pseudooceanicola spongiae]